MNRRPKNICVVLGSAPGYSETFLKTHIEKLATAVRYLEHFPIDVDDEFPEQSFSDGSERLKQTLRASYHRYILNPIKKTTLRNFFKAKKLDAVLAEYGVTGMVALKACKELAIPLFVHFHGFDAHNREVLDQCKERYKKMFDYSSAIIAVSRSMCESLVAIGAPREKVIYNPYGVEIGESKRPYGLNSPPQVIAVGRFVEKKAPYLTILAFKKVLERLPAARLVMLGDGALHDVSQQIVKSLHIEQAVDLRGAVEHDQALSLMRQSRVFVQHSLVPRSGDSEGTPVAILEAGANGIPVVSTWHAGISDAVIHGETGFLVEEGDIDGMADHIHSLLIDPELAAQMGNRAREHIKQNFSLERSIENLRQIVEKFSP